MPTTDRETVAAITAVAENHKLLIDFRYHKGDFRTVYLQVPGPANDEERITLRSAQACLANSGIHGAIMTHITNPNHPSYMRPMLEIDSIWWPQE